MEPALRKLSTLAPDRRVRGSGSMSCAIAGMQVLTSALAGGEGNFATL